MELFNGGKREYLWDTYFVEGRLTGEPQLTDEIKELEWAGFDPNQPLRLSMNGYFRSVDVLFHPILKAYLARSSMITARRPGLLDIRRPLARAAASRHLRAEIWGKPSLARLRNLRVARPR